MKYIVLGDDSKEYGPIDAETLRKWVESGRVMPHTQVRNALLKNKWADAEHLEFLRGSFVVLDERCDDEAGLIGRLGKMMWTISGTQKPEKIKKSAFRHAYIPQPAPVPPRMLAWIFDMILLAIPGAGFAVIFWSLEKSGMAINAAFHLVVIMYVAFVMLYYGLALGICAQTFGMWFWGIMLAKDGDNPNDIEEAYLLRAYCFTLAMFAFGIFVPLAMVLPRQRAIHDLLTGCSVIGIAAKPKA